LIFSILNFLFSFLFIFKKMSSSPSPSPPPTQTVSDKDKTDAAEVTKIEQDSSSSPPSHAHEEEKHHTEEEKKQQHHRIVIGFTTIPSRCDKLEETLVSLASQTMKPDAIYISVSKESRKEKKPYPIKELSKLVKRILPVGVGRVIVLEEDYGPLTKLMGPLMQESDPNTFIITVDDDQKYGERLVETLVRGAQQFPNSAVCLCGHVIGKFPNFWGFRCSRKDRVWPLKLVYLEPGSRVDTIAGWCGVLYPRGVFGPSSSVGLDADAVATIPDPGFESLRKEELPILDRFDDLYISAWLDSRKVPRFVVAYDEKDVPKVTDDQLKHAATKGMPSLSCGDKGPSAAQGIKHANEFWSVIKALQSRGLLLSDVKVKWYNSMSTLATIGTLIVVVSAVGVILYYRYGKKRATPAVISEKF
jgi:hypothetical protein